MKNFKSILILTILAASAAFSANIKVPGKQESPNNIGVHTYTPATTARAATNDVLILLADSTTGAIVYFTSSSWRSAYNYTTRNFYEPTPDSVIVELRGRAQADSTVASVVFEYGKGGTDTTFRAMPAATCTFTGTTSNICRVGTNFIPNAMFRIKVTPTSSSDSLYLEKGQDHTIQK
jgi:hypothetical protein